MRANGLLCAFEELREQAPQFCQVLNHVFGPRHVGRRQLRLHKLDGGPASDLCGFAILVRVIWDRVEGQEAGGEGEFTGKSRWFTGCFQETIDRAGGMDRASTHRRSSTYPLPTRRLLSRPCATSPGWVCRSTAGPRSRRR
jgi:hypothetical protein